MYCQWTEARVSVKLGALQWTSHIEESVETNVSSWEAWETVWSLFKGGAKANRTNCSTPCLNKTPEKNDIFHSTWKGLKQQDITEKCMQWITEYITTSCARSNLNINIILKLLSEIFCFFFFNLYVHVHVYVCHAYATTFWNQKMSEPLKLELQVIRSHLGCSEGAVQTPNHQVISSPEPCF